MSPPRKHARAVVVDRPVTVDPYNPVNLPPEMVDPYSPYARTLSAPRPKKGAKK